MGFFVSLLCGFIPMLLYASFILWLDRYEKEPKILLGGVFVWGAVIAAGTAYIINTSFGMGVYLITGSETASDIATGSLEAPVVEEFFKGLAVLIVFLVWRREFDSILDGIVYAAITAMGFAATENMFYIYDYGFMENGWEGLINLAFIRVILVGWQHPFYTAFVGIGLATARLNRNWMVKIGAPLLGLLCGVTAHSLHNSILPLFMETDPINGWVASTVFDWSGWLTMFGFAVWMMLRERKMAIRLLLEEVETGTISAQQYRTAYALFGKGWVKTRALFKRKFGATSRFYQLCGELMHKKNQLARMGDEDGNRVIIEGIREELGRLSAVVGG